MVDERIAARRAEVRDERRRRRLRRTVLVATLLALLLVAYLVERSSLVALAEVRVEGTERLDAGQIRQVAALELGTSTLRLPLARAHDDLVALPLVESAVVRRLDPLTVLIEVIERSPMATVVRGRRHVMVDDDGVVIATGTEPGLPRIEVRSGPLPAVGETIATSPAAANAHAALLALPAPIRTVVTTYVARSADDLDLVLESGTMVRFGRAARVDEKARALGAVLEDLAGRDVIEIDVRAPARPVVVPAQS